MSQRTAMWHRSRLSVSKTNANAPDLPRPRPTTPSMCTHAMTRIIQHSLMPSPSRRAASTVRRLEAAQTLVVLGDLREERLVPPWHWAASRLECIWIARHSSRDGGRDGSIKYRTRGKDNRRPDSSLPPRRRSRPPADPSSPSSSDGADSAIGAMRRPNESSARRPEAVGATLRRRRPRPRTRMIPPDRHPDGQADQSERSREHRAEECGVICEECHHAVLEGVAEGHAGEDGSERSHGRQHDKLVLGLHFGRRRRGRGRGVGLVRASRRHGICGLDGRLDERRVCVLWVGVAKSRTPPQPSKTLPCLLLWSRRPRLSSSASASQEIGVVRSSARSLYNSVKDLFSSSCRRHGRVGGLQVPLLPVRSRTRRPRRAAPGCARGRADDALPYAESGAACRPTTR